MEFTKIEDLKKYRLYKVCQVTSNEIPELYFVEDGCGHYHKDILKKILNIKGLTPEDVPKVLNREDLIYQGEGVTVNGMGGAMLLSEKNIMLFSKNVKFDMHISRSHAEKFKWANPGWEFEIQTLSRAGESLAS